MSGPAIGCLLAEIWLERERQDAKWGEQNHLSVRGSEQDRAHLGSLIASERLARGACEQAAREGRLTWLHIAIEELAEVLEAGPDGDARREELVQLAAVIVAWIECLDRRLAPPGAEGKQP